MAIINYTHKFIFIHVPKAAGTSITKALSTYTEFRDLEIGGTRFGEGVQPFYSERFGVYKHIPASKLRKIVGKSEWEDFFVFSFVRDPFSRAVSIFNFLRAWPGCPDATKTAMLSFDDVNDFILSGMIKDKAGPDEIFRPQSFWLTDPDNIDAVIVDKVYRLENIGSSLNDLSQRIGLRGFSSLAPRINESRKEARVSDLTPESRRKLIDFYRRDFRLFGYED